MNTVSLCKLRVFLFMATSQNELIIFTYGSHSVEVKAVGRRAQRGGSTFDKCFVYEKNLLHGRFVEENTARLIRCGRFQMGGWGRWQDAIVCPLPHTEPWEVCPIMPHWVAWEERSHWLHSHLFLTFLLLLQLHPLSSRAGGELETLKPCCGPISIQGYKGQTFNGEAGFTAAVCE